MQSGKIPQKDSNAQSPSKRDNGLPAQAAPSSALYWQSAAGGANTVLLTEIAQDPTLSAHDKLAAVKPHVVEVSVPEYLETLREQYQKTYTQIANGCSDMDRGYIIDIFKGRRFTTRDNFIKILYFGIGATLDETRRFCRFAQVGDLVPQVDRDLLLIMCMEEPGGGENPQPVKKRMSLMDINLALDGIGFVCLGQSFTDIEKGLGLDKDPWPKQDSVPTMLIKSYIDQGLGYSEVAGQLKDELVVMGTNEESAYRHREITPALYLRWMLKQRDMSVKVLSQRAYVKYDSMKQYVNGLRKKPRDRNVALRMVFALRMSVRQAQNFLNIAQCGRLWPKAALGRDMLIMHAIATNMSLEDADHLLKSEGMAPLIPAGQAEGETTV